MRLSGDAEKGLHDLYFFLKRYWKLDLEEKPHVEMCGIIQESEEDTRHPYGIEVVPRGTYKTTIGRGAVVWKQLRQIFIYENFYYRVVLASATLAHSYASLRVIEGQLKYNKDLNEAYGPLWKTPKFMGDANSHHTDGIVLAPRIEAGEIASVAEPSFWVGSSGRISTGFHANSALFDDLNNWKNTTTEVQREKIHKYWYDLFSILDPTDRNGNPATIIFNATPYHDDDVRGRILRNERLKKETVEGYESPYVILQKPCDGPDGLFFPSKYSKEVLLKIRENTSAREYAANYLVDPVGDRGFVDESEIRFKPRSTFPSPLRHFRATVDPNHHSKSRELGCYAAIMVSGYDNFSNLYFYDARGSRDWDTKEFIDELFDLNELYTDIPILIEDSNMSHFSHAIGMEEATRGIRLKIHYIKRTDGSSKVERWQKLQPRFKNGRVTFAEEINPALKMEITEELIRGEASRFKDFLDAMEMAEIGVRPKIVNGEVKHQKKDVISIPGALTFGDALPPELSRMVKLAAEEEEKRRRTIQ